MPDPRKTRSKRDDHEDEEDSEEKEATKSQLHPLQYRIIPKRKQRCMTHSIKNR